MEAWRRDTRTDILSKSNLVTRSHISVITSNPGIDQAEDFVPCTQDDPIVEIVLSTWTKEIIDTADDSRFIAPNDIHAMQKEVDVQFERIGVWKHEDEKELLLIIIREIGTDMYEWMHSIIKKKVKGKELGKIWFALYSHEDVDQNTRIVIDGEGTKRLTEISSLFAQQRIDAIQNWDLKTQQVENQESEKRSAIQRNTKDLFPEVSASLFKRCTRRQFEIEILRTEVLDGQKLQRQLDYTNQALKTEREGHKKRESRWTSEKLKRFDKSDKIQSMRMSMKRLQDENESVHRENSEMSDRLDELRIRNEMLEGQNADIQRHVDDALQLLSIMNGQHRCQKYQDLEHGTRQLVQSVEEETRQQLVNLMEGDAVLLTDRANTENLKTEEREDAQDDSESNQQQHDSIHWKEQLQEKETEMDYWIIMALLIGGGIFAVIGLIIFMLARRTYKQMSEEKMYDLNAQSEIIRPYEPMPVIPSAHANGLGIHEHPAVRDVFGMKKSWDVTCGLGVDVARITGEKKTRQEATTESAELSKRNGYLNVSQVPGPSGFGKEDVERLSVVVGLPPPPPNVDIDAGSDVDVVIGIPCDILDQDRPLCVSADNTKIHNEAEEDAQMRLNEL